MSIAARSRAPRRPRPSQRRTINSRSSSVSARCALPGSSRRTSSRSRSAVFSAADRESGFRSRSQRRGVMGRGVASMPPPHQREQFRQQSSSLATRADACSREVAAVNCAIPLPARAGVRAAPGSSEPGLRVVVVALLDALAVPALGGIRGVARMTFGARAEAPTLAPCVRIALDALAESAHATLSRRPRPPTHALIEAVLDLFGCGGVLVFLFSHIYGMRRARPDVPSRVSRLTMLDRCPRVIRAGRSGGGV